MATRQYIPGIGKRVKLKLWEDYTSRGLSPWSWLAVLSINGQDVTADVLDGNEITGKQVTVPLSVIDPPVGWKPRYTINVKAEKVDEVLSWFTRGIVCRQSHDLNPHYMPMAFQPMDNAGQPGWQFPELTDSVPADECPKVFRVVKYEEEDINFVVDMLCKWCHGTGRRNISGIAETRGITIDALHDEIMTRNDNFFANYDATEHTFECHCRNSGFRALTKKQRDALAAEWAKDGWKTEYVRVGGGFWQRTRETVVHDWTA